MAHYPIHLNLESGKCVVIGGGAVAERKVQSLLDFGARVTVVAPEVTPTLSRLADTGKIQRVDDAYRPGMLAGAVLVIAATDDSETNKAVSEEAQALGIPVNVVDDPDLCTFFVPSVLRRGDLVISVSTSGKSPSLAKRLREKLESCIGPEYGELADLLGELRDEVKARYQDPSERNKAYARILDSDVLDLLSQGRRDDAAKRARECI